jgi:hypothetical protein
MFSQVMHIVSALNEYFKSSFLKSPKLEGSFLFPKIKQFLYKQKIRYLPFLWIDVGDLGQTYDLG